MAAYNANNLETAHGLFAQAARLAPYSALVMISLGVTLRRLRRFPAAALCQRRALAIDPNNGAAWSNLGNCLRDLEQHEESESALRRAVEIDPTSPLFRFNLALLLRDRRKLAESEEILGKLVQECPTNADYAWDYGLIKLQRGDYIGGFRHYEARWGLQRAEKRYVPGTRWTGEDLQGKTIFLHAEQGFGDALQFIRFVPFLKGRGAARVILECQPELLELFAAAPGVDQVIAKQAAPPPYDVWAPLLSLPHILGITLETLPRTTPYLVPPKPLNMRVALPPATKLTVGVVWAGKPTPRDRSWPLGKVMSLFGDPRIIALSLQKGPRSEDLVSEGVQGLIHDVSPMLNSFAETAAWMWHLDLIVTVDTSVAHLAGALGRPCWLLLRWVSDWRWFDEPEESVWYPNTRLFRQTHPDDWDGPVERMRAALNALLQERLAVSPPRPIQPIATDKAESPS